MEKISAASAMEWSIELEKGLRSKKPGKLTEEISKFGSRLEQWCRESRVTVVECKMFDLIPGEEKLYLNAIFLRLADAFRSGDKETKRCIVRIFIQYLKGRRKKKTNSNRKGGDGILSKSMLGNYLEILRRVKVVFDNGDVEERALALALFGCWAEIAKDSGDIRYVLLSSLVSDHILEVKASFFAAGCFCELADDFACVLLEILVNMLSSSEISKSLEFRIGVCRAFARMSCSFLVAKRAYEQGLILLSDSCEEIFSSAMLISLTKIASKWTLLIPGLLDLLVSFLAEDKPLQIQETALRCLSFLLNRGLSLHPAAVERIESVISVFHDSKIQPALLCKALKVLHKVILYNLSSFPDSRISDVFTVLLMYTKKMIQCSVMSKRLIALHALVNLSGNPLVRDNCHTLAPQVISLIVQRISILVRSNVDTKQTDSEMEQEVTNLLNLVPYMVRRYSDGAFLMDKICELIGDIRSMLDKNISTKEKVMTEQESSKFGRENVTEVILRFSFLLAKAMMACFEKVDATDAVARQALHSLKLLLEYVHKTIPFDSYTLRMYFLLLQSNNVYRCMWRVLIQVLDFDTATTTTPFLGDSFCDHEVFSLECAKKIIEGRDYWSSYKAGKYAACQGSWSTSAFIFEQLMDKVQSDSYRWWLKSLTLLSNSESQIQLFGHVLSKGSLSGDSVSWKINSCNYAGSLLELQKTLRDAKEIVGTSFTGVLFSFQKWFIVLRVKVLERILDFTRLLITFLSTKQSSCSGQPQFTCSNSSQMSLQEINDLVYSSREISYQLKKIACQLDLFAISFNGMDRESIAIISALSISCSLLAFSITFALSISSDASEKFRNSGLNSSLEELYITLIQDLLGRLWNLDPESSHSLLRLLNIYKNSGSCFLLESQSQAAESSFEGRVIAKLCRYAVSGLVALQNESSGFHSPESSTQTCHVAIELLLNVISKWMQIPFRCPIQFFQPRPYVSSVLVATNEDGQNMDGKFILSGSDLLLNVCLQLENVPSYMKVQFSKLYCILSCTMLSSDTEMKEQSLVSSKNGEIDDIFDLNKKLLQYVTGSAKTTGTDVGNNDVDCSVDKYIYLHPSGRYQGFSTCLLDIAAFPVGVYQIKWHSCCIDSEGSYWSLLPQNVGPIFNIQRLPC